MKSFRTIQTCGKIYKTHLILGDLGIAIELKWLLEKCHELHRHLAGGASELESIVLRSEDLGMQIASQCPSGALGKLHFLLFWQTSCTHCIVGEANNMLLPSGHKIETY
jgi:hypothetical protein